MNYRHLYHAGNFSDVFKHCILISLINSLSKKDKPFCYLETHAGAGCYDLRQLACQQNKEYESGIARLIQSFNNEALAQEATIRQYLEIIKQQDYPNFYPGSPLIARNLLRNEDRMILSELHQEDFRALKRLFNKDKHQPLKIELHNQDGYQSLKALLPPKERRGLIFIDPPFEQNNEWQRMIETTHIALQKFANGIFAIWYPLKDKDRVQDFKHSLENMLLKTLKNLGNILVAEMSVYPEDVQLKLTGCGMIIINVPWQLEHSLENLLSSLWSRLAWRNTGSYSVKNNFN